MIVSQPSLLSVVEVWRRGCYLCELRRVTKAGLRAILASPWYLDQPIPTYNWARFYKVWPLAFMGQGKPVCRVRLQPLRIGDDDAFILIVFVVVSFFVVNGYIVHFTGSIFVCVTIGLIMCALTSAPLGGTKCLKKAIALTTINIMFSGLFFKI